MSGYQRRDRVGGLPYNRRSMPGEGYGGGGQQRGYRPTTAPPRSQVVSPWESGVVPMAGAMRGGSGQAGGYQHSSGGCYNQDIGGSINQLNQMGNQESEIALNILNAVLNTSGLDTGNHGSGRMSWGGEPRPSKMRRVDWGDGYESQQRWMGPGMQQGARKMPGQSWSEGSRHAWGYSRSTFSRQDRRKLTAKKGNINTAGKNQNAQKKKKDTPAGKGAAAGKATVKNQKKTPDAPAGGGATDQKEKDDAPNVKEAGAETTTTDTKEDIKKETNPDTNQSETTDAAGARKETSDDGEKDNQNKADNTAEGKENETDVTEAGNDNQNKDKNESLPVEALNCHICMKNFKTPNGYQNHLSGKNHEKVAEVYIQKSDKLLNFLKTQSRLASQQNIVSKSKGQIKSCRKCDCPIKGGMPLHIPLRQHTLVVNFKTCSICKLRFSTRWKLEKHHLTQQHLKNQYDFKKRIEERNLESAKVTKKEYDFPEMEAMNKVHDAVDQLILANFTSQAWIPRMIPPYDPAIPIGLNFIERNPQFYCTICSKKILHTSKGALYHFRSRKHYDNYFNLLKNIEGKEKKQGDEENQSDEDPKLAVNEEMEVSEELGKEKKQEDEENQSDEDPKLAVNEEMEVSEELGREQKQGDEENQDDKDPKLAVNEEMEVSEELASLKEALEEVGETFCDVGESMKETLDSAEQQSQDEKPSESSEVEASAPTPSESDSNNQPTEKDTVDLKSTENKTEISKSTENKTEISKSTENKTEISKSSENKTEIPKSTENKTEIPKSTENKTEIPKSTENKTEISKSTENKTEIPQSTENKTEILKSTENKTEIPKSTENKTKIAKSTENKTEIPKSTENKTKIAKSTVKTETPSQVEEVSDTPQADQEVVTLSSSDIESTKKRTERKSSTSTPAKKSTSAARPVKSKRAVTTTEAEDNASTTSTEIEATEKIVVEKKADIPPRTPRATAKRGRGRGRGGKIKAAKN